MFLSRKTSNFGFEFLGWTLFKKVPQIWLFPWGWFPSHKRAEMCSQSQCQKHSRSLLAVPPHLQFASFEEWISWTRRFVSSPGRQAWLHLRPVRVPGAGRQGIPNASILQEREEGRDVQGSEVRDLNFETLSMTEHFFLWFLIWGKLSFAWRSTGRLFGYCKSFFLFL